ncbi:hypothetical protein A8144_09785 [Mycobacterium leprae 3125609]|nr:hypothetical protein A8144_09785 [Mycobacterium leprae 3125609]OAX70837.1 hypothetical protein A3216_09570 [Mycobacterium leprae 7935681]
MGPGAPLCGRWSYARPGVNLAQGNLNSMPYFAVSAKLLGHSADGAGHTTNEDGEARKVLLYKSPK